MGFMLLPSKFTHILILLFSLLNMIGCMNSPESIDLNCEVSGKVIVPQSLKLDFQKIEVSYPLVDSVPINKNGEFCISKKLFKGRVTSRGVARETGGEISAWVPIEGVEGYEGLYPLISAMIYPDENFVELSLRSTAATLIKSLSNSFKDSISKKRYHKVYKLNEVKEIANFFERELSIDIGSLTGDKLWKNKNFIILFKKAAEAADKLN